MTAGKHGPRADAHGSTGSTRPDGARQEQWQATGRAHSDSDRVTRLLEHIESDLAASGIQTRGFREIESREIAVTDAATKVMIGDGSGRPAAVLLLSPPAAPGIVRRTMGRARRAAERLGPDLGSVALLPLLGGEFEGLSYAVLPWQRTLADTRWRWRVQRTWLAPRLLRWLRAVLEATTCDLDEAQLTESVRFPLQRLVGDARFSGEMRRNAEVALNRVSGGHWRPVFVLVHGDLWKGNILLPRDSVARRTTAYDFHLIDWAASQLAGFAFWDFAQLGLSLSLPLAWARHELRRHAEILGCEPRDALCYLLVAVAGLGGGLEHMPVERYVGGAERLHRFLRSCLVGEE